jgi:hypothetical protein
MTRTLPAIIPPGTWPRRMSPQLAAGYCGERSVQTFLKACKKGEYPPPQVNKGRRKIWLKDDLDRSIGREHDPAAARDVALDL